MNKKLFVIVLSLIFVISGALAYVWLLPKDTADTETRLAPQPESTSNSPTEPTAQVGKYVDYTPAAVSSAKGTKLLFFHAPWCPQCRQVEDSINTEGLPDGVTVFKVDYDSNQALRQRYGVTIQTTFIKIDDNGNKIASYVAYEEPRFSSVQRELLP